jgi:hypothetical protein
MCGTMGTSLAVDSGFGGLLEIDTGKDLSIYFLKADAIPMELCDIVKFFVSQS